MIINKFYKNIIFNPLNNNTVCFIIVCANWLTVIDSVGSLLGVPNKYIYIFTYSALIFYTFAYFAMKIGKFSKTN